MSFKFDTVDDAVRDSATNADLTRHLEAGLQKEDDHAHFFANPQRPWDCYLIEELTILEVATGNTTGLNGDITKTISGEEYRIRTMFSVNSITHGASLMVAR